MYARPNAATAPQTPRQPLWRAGVTALLLACLATHVGLAQTTQPTKSLTELFQEVLSGQSTPADAAPDGEVVLPPTAIAPGPDSVTATETGLLDLHVRDIEMATLLEMLSYEARANIVTSTSVGGQVSANLYAVTLDEALAAVLTPNQYAFRPIGSTTFVGTPAEIAAMQPGPTTRVFKLHYIRPPEAATAIKAVLSETGSVVEGGGGQDDWGGGAKESEMASAGVDYLIVTDQPDRLDAAAELLAQIDERPRQVLIEATVLRATLNEDNELGIDFSFLGGVDFQGVGSTSNAAADLLTGALPPDRLQSTTFNVNTDFAGNVTGGGFTFGVIKDSIAAFIRALEEVTDVVVVANPKIVALNKQPGEVIVGRRDGYLTTTVTETAAIQTVEFLETGTQISFRPVINDDGTVRLSVHPKDSNGGLTAANLPFEETTEAHADILVDDGETVLIGGLFRERTISSRSQVPVLGNIPVIGLLFGSRSDQTVREEVIILLTVHVIKDTADERARYRALVDDVERVRVGSRRGLLGTGRERLAQAYFREALAKLEEGDSKRALLNVRMTLSNQPKHLTALKLQERLLDERLWDVEGTRMRTFIWELIELDDPAEQSATPPFGRPRVNLPAPVADDGDQ